MVGIVPITINLPLEMVALHQFLNGPWAVAHIPLVVRREGQVGPGAY
jgi:hypothetical protein